MAAQAHVPCEYIVRFRTRGSNWQDFDVPAHRQPTRDDLSASFQMQSPQVPDREERAVVDAVDDKPCAARRELPLPREVVSRHYVRCMELDAVQHGCATTNSHNHIGQEEGGLVSSSLTEGKENDDSRLLVIPPMKRICIQ